MTNAEFYKNEILKYAFNGDKAAIKKDTSELCKCTKISCSNCLFQSECNIEGFLEWCNSEYTSIDPRITKSTPIDTKILVSDDNVNWFKRHFAKIENNKVYTWDAGTTSFTTNVENITAWSYAKLYKE